MENKNDGGPAFPTCIDMGHVHGMSLRDYFAGQAIVALIVSADRAFQERYTQEAPTIREVVSDAFRYADEMLAQREKTS